MDMADLFIRDRSVEPFIDSTTQSVDVKDFLRAIEGGCLLQEERLHRAVEGKRPEGQSPFRALLTVSERSVIL